MCMVVTLKFISLLPLFGGSLKSLRPVSTQDSGLGTRFDLDTTGNYGNSGIQERDSSWELRDSVQLRIMRLQLRIMRLQLRIMRLQLRILSRLSRNLRQAADNLRNSV